MIWAILALLGVPLWLCALAIGVTIMRNRSLRKRLGDVPVRARLAGKKRWTRGHGTWVHDVFAFRASPAVWQEHLLWVDSVTIRPASQAEHKKLHRLGSGFVIAHFQPPEGAAADFATSAAHSTALMGAVAGATTSDPALSRGNS